MELSVRYLGDTSAVARLGVPAVQRILRPQVEEGRVATCAILDLEAGYSARNARELEQVLEVREGAFPWVPMPDGVWNRVAAVQALLVAAGTHRGVGIPDLLIAATAEFHGLSVLHYDHDFDIIASVTGQDTRWIVERGSLESGYAALAAAQDDEDRAFHDAMRPRRGKVGPDADPPNE